MEIVFIRHGQTDVNKDNRLQGALIDAELNEAGRDYAKKAADNFDENEFDVVYSSPMKRAVETAKIFTKGKKEIKLDKRLLEFDFGDWDGMKMEEIGEKYPDVVDPWGKINRQYIKYAPNGESYEAFDERCGEFLDEMYQKYPDKKVLVVAHGRLIRMMAAHYLTKGDMDLFDTMDNCALAKFSIRKGITRMDYYNRKLA
ncbi:histidine phosphatase family protein [Lactobacillus hamsteri]|uniref:Phosphoglycerate mutase n=1 Tax=Lactobacillus hamsteri DSM 5661 = JCM 6256 TaxID=1423754 RepID=A0A0R1YGK3_9LACO|nr:histidine phosphatase family protein [Lactobacillus hamsteri]KRM40068.1 phosphoglycerate mutase [Lactobacillus hamsteri DSM 5661 = JCM 6256]